jgi:tRNA modification GTPase
VFNEPGTTRDVLSVETAIDGWPVRLTDAAGIRETCDPLEAEGVVRARAELQHADLLLWVVDLSQFKTVDAFLKLPRKEATTELRAMASNNRPRLLFVGNKLDLVIRRPKYELADAVFVSALKRDGIEKLLSAISRRLVPSPPSPGQGVPFTPRQIETLISADWFVRRYDARRALKSLAQLRQAP